MADVKHPPVRIAETSVDDLREICHDHPKTLYAILDACDEPRVPQQIRELEPERAVSLYRGSAEREYWAIAPYLVHVDAPLLVWIIGNFWEDPWGIFVVSSANLTQLRSHFRRFLTVADPDGEPMYFRFYDPRVLHNFLETCSVADIGSFFGPVDHFLCSKSPHALTQYSKQVP